MIRWGASLLLLLAGCTFEVGIEDIPCRSDAWCPTGTWCDLQPEQELGVCTSGDRPIDDDDSSKDDDDSAPDDDDSTPIGDDDDSVKPTGSVFISEVYALPIGDGAEGLQWIELSNSTGTSVELADWTIEVQHGSPSNADRWILPPMVIGGGGQVVLAATERAATEQDVPGVEAVWGTALRFGEDVSLVRLLKDDGVAAMTLDPSVFQPAVGASVNLSGEVDCFGPEPGDAGACWCVSPAPRWSGNGGYGTPNQPNPQCPEPLAAGDIIITEVLLVPAPDGAMERQWVELRNVSGVTRSLTATAIDSASSPSPAVLYQGEAVGAGEHILLGNPLAFSDAPDVHVGYSIDLPMEAADEVLSFWSNPDGLPVLIDRVDMTGPAWNLLEGQHVGRAISLSPGAQTAILNDAAAAWCPSSGDTYGPNGDHGTPGYGNPSCSPLGDDDDATGDDDDATGDDDDTVPPPDDDDASTSTYDGIVITEIMVDPSGLDLGREWFEVKNTTASTIDLFGLNVQIGSHSHVVLASLPVPGFGSKVLGQSANPAVNGNMNVDYAYTDTLVMEHDSTISLTDAAWIVDEVMLSAPAFPVVEGASISLDPTVTNVLENDLGSSWCITPAGAYTTLPSGQRLYGDPSSANSVCPAPLGPGEVFITEIQNSPLTTDLEREWFELYNDSGQKVSLFGWELQTNGGYHEVIDGLLVLPGDEVVLAWNQNSAVNGGVGETYYSYGSALDFDASLDVLTVTDRSGNLQDSVAWDTAAGWPDTPSGGGATLSLSDNAYGASLNDVLEAWCLSSGPAYGDGGFGTPAFANASCAPSGPCAGAPGELIITEVMRDSSLGVDGEWIEVFNPGPGPVYIGDYELSDGTVTATWPAGNYQVPSLGRAVLAHTADPGTNGGLTALAAYESAGLDLDATSGALELTRAADGCLVDGIWWDGTFATDPGHSAQLSPLFTSQIENDDPQLWCDPPGSGTFGLSPDVGTPGVANDHCSEPWWNGPSFCVGGPSLNDYDASHSAIQSLWEASRLDDALLVVPTENASSADMEVTLKGTTGTCDMNPTWSMSFTSASTPPSTVSIGPISELGLAATPFDLVIEEATVTMDFDASSGNIGAVSVTGWARPIVVDPSFCTNHGCMLCPVTSTFDCTYIELEGGGGSALFLPW